MRLSSGLVLLCLFARHGVQHVQGRVGDVELFEETPAPTESPTDAPTTAPTTAPTDSPSEIPTEHPTDMPIYIPPIEADGVGAVCVNFEYLDGDTQTCEFNSCGGSVTMSQCSAIYSGDTSSGAPYCNLDTKLQLYLNGGLLASAESGSGGPCGCPTLVYFLEENNCQTYQLVQSCAIGFDNCAGRTAVFSTPEDDDDALVGVSVDAAGDGGICDAYTIASNTDQDVPCQFTTCGAVVITQCTNDGYNANGGPEPSYSANNMIEVFKVGDPTMLASSVNSGPCGGPKIDFVPVEMGCQSYKIRQTCTNGATDCGGRTAIYTVSEPSTDPTTDPTEALSAAPSEAPTETPTNDPTINPSVIPSEIPSEVPSMTPSEVPSETPSSAPADAPTPVPTNNPTNVPTPVPTSKPTNNPTNFPTNKPSHLPTTVPTNKPTTLPTPVPTSNPTNVPTTVPTTTPTANPTTVPTTVPTAVPTPVPTAGPTAGPTAVPTAAPTAGNTVGFSFKVRNGFAFAVPTSAGDLFTLGEVPYGGLLPGDVNFDTFGAPVSYVVASRFAFLAVLADQSAVTWGVLSALNGTVPGSVRDVVANEAAFAGIDVTSGGVFAIGSKHNGGNVLDDARCNGFADELSADVSSVVPSSCSFTAIKTDGSVYTWGNTHCGGGISSETRTELVNVQKVFATREAFAAILSGGAVKTWGGQLAGGDSSAVASALGAATVVDIFASKSVFVALTSTNGLIAWGYGPYGGDMSAVQSNLNSGVERVAFTFTACAALKTNGDVYVWGRADSGGDASSVSGGLHNIVSVVGNSKAFAAINSDGGVVAWGKAEYGGTIPGDKVTDLSSDVIAIYHTDRAFAALKSTGQLVVWGQAGHGGSPGAVIETLLLSGVYEVYSNDVAFAALKSDGSVVAWGHPVSVPSAGVQLVSEMLTRAPSVAPTAAPTV